MSRASMIASSLTVALQLVRSHLLSEMPLRSRGAVAYGDEASQTVAAVQHFHAQGLKASRRIVASAVCASGISSSPTHVASLATGSPLATSRTVSVAIDA